MIPDEVGDDLILGCVAAHDLEGIVGLADVVASKGSAEGQARRRDGVGLGTTEFQ